MRFWDAFHGIGGFRYGLEQAGMTCVGGCEIDKYACKAYGVINNEQCEPTDIRGIIPERLPNFDVFVGGFPCQDLSIAGQRKGFDGERSILYFEILRICAVKKPKYILLENVTGLLSHNEGDTFETVLKSLDELGYDAEWQVHNSAAYVPQNRERIFIIASARGSSGRKIFPFGAENSKPIEVIGKLEGNYDQNSRVYGSGGVSPCLSTMQGGGQEPKVLVMGNTNPSGNGMNGQVYNSPGLAPTLTTNKGEGNKIAIPCLTPDREEKRQNGRRFKEPGEPMFTLTAQDKHGVAIGKVTCINPRKEDGTQTYQHDRVYDSNGIMTCLAIDESGRYNVVHNYRIRKLTPKECFRLQSFPDWWYDKCKEHDISDSQLYKMAGNAVTSAVAYEIGKRLMG